MKMIPLSAWVSLSVGALLIGLEYIAPTVVTAASNIAALPLLSISARSTFLRSGLPSANGGRCSCADVGQIQNKSGSDPNQRSPRRLLMCPKGLSVIGPQDTSPPGLTKSTVTPPPYCNQEHRCWHWSVKVIYSNEIQITQACGLIVALFVNIFR